MPKSNSTPPLSIDILCLFPQSLNNFFSFGQIGRAIRQGIVSVRTHNLRAWTKDKRQTVDDRPYGGGAGMILKPEPLAAAVASLNKKYRNRTRVILTSASGKTFSQKEAMRLSQLKHLIIIGGRYEGIDQRFIETYVDEEISLGDYVITGGELAAAVIAEAVSRLVTGTLGNPDSLEQESFNQNLLEYPQYTRPGVFEGKRVPAVLLSGNHQKIKQWQLKKSLEKTKKIRPDLLNRR